MAESNEVPVTAGRERKTVQRFAVSAEKVTKTFEVESGSGITLGNYPFFCKNLEKLHGDSEQVFLYRNLNYA